MSKKAPRPTAGQVESQATETHSVHESKLDSLGLERLIFFSDAVFAIAITLLALDIRLPVAADELSSAELLGALLALWPKYFSYFVSFAVIGLFWLSHHRKFRYIERYDSRLLYINLVLLLFVAFVPFPTAVLSETVNQTSVSFYALSIVALGLASASVWWYAAYHRRLLSPAASEGLIRNLNRQGLLPPTLFGLSMLVAAINPTWAMVIWLLLLPGFILLHL